MFALQVVPESKNNFTQFSEQDNPLSIIVSTKSLSHRVSESCEKRTEEVVTTAIVDKDTVLLNPAPNLLAYRIVSWNILFPSHQKHAKKCLRPWEERVHEIFNKIIATKADIGCLQEAQQPYFERLKEMLVKAGYTPIFDPWKYPRKKEENMPPDKNKSYRLGKEGCVIFYRESKFKKLSSHSLSLKDTTGRRLQVVQLVPKEGQGSSFHVFNAHLMWIHSKALEQVRFIVNEMSKIKGPQVFCGDFNSPPDDVIFGELRKAGFVDVLNDRGIKGFTYVADHGGQNHGKVGEGVRTDYICMRDHEGFFDASIVGEFNNIRTPKEPSDHLMVSADLLLPKNELYRDDELVKVLGLFSEEDFSEIVRLSSELSVFLEVRLYELVYLLERKKGMQIEGDPIEFGRCAYLREAEMDVSSPSIRKDAFQLLMLEKVVIPLLEKGKRTKAFQLFSFFDAKIRDEVFKYVYQIEKKAKRQKEDPKFGAQAFLSDKYKTSDKTRINAIKAFIERKINIIEHNEPEIKKCTEVVRIAIDVDNKEDPSPFGIIGTLEDDRSLQKTSDSQSLIISDRLIQKSVPQSEGSFTEILKLFSIDDVDEIAKISTGLPELLQERLYEFTYLLEKKNGIHIEEDPIKFGRCAYLKIGGADVSSPSISKNAFKLLMLEKVVIPLLEQGQKDRAFQLFALFDSKMHGVIFKFVYKIEKDLKRYKHHSDFGRVAFLTEQFGTPNKTRIKAIQSLILKMTV